MRLAIQLIGTPQFQVDGVPVTPSRRAVVALLAYLTVSSSEHPEQRVGRESLASLLWTDYDQTKALANLRHTLWEVTKFLGEGWIIPEHETIRWNANAQLSLDVAGFRSLIRQASQAASLTRRISALEDAASLYRGEFLSGFSLREGPNFNEWAAAQGQKLHHEFVSALQALVEEYRALDQPQSALPHAQQLTALDPLNEAAHRELMELYALSQQYPAAIRQYQALEKLLRREINVDPQPETRELYKKIRRGQWEPVARASKIPRWKKTAARQNLPVHLTTFIGREKERGDIRRLVTQARLVTLIGAGGIGKTRLALQSAGNLSAEFPDGVWFVSLESLTEEELMPKAVASALGVPEAPGQTMAQSLVDALRDQTTLLIFDNCEHLLDACAGLIDALLKECPRLRVVATSRQALLLEGEALYHVHSLAIPAGVEDRSVTELADYESVRLFAERAVLAASAFEITERNVRTVIDICQRLDGIPLAIELAAARLDLFRVEELRSQLDRSFDLLATHTRSVLPRHQTMRTCIEWGWNLLGDAEQDFVRKLAVFSGGWTLQAAQALGIADPLELTAALSKKSFVVVDLQAAQETRYSFHEVIRAYALEKLVEAGEEKAQRDLHLDYYLQLARQFEPALHGVNQRFWLERLFLERHNIRAALEWAARTNVHAGLYLSIRLRTFWESCDLPEEKHWLLML